MSFDPKLPEDGINVTPSHPLSELSQLVGGVLGVAAAIIITLLVLTNLVIPLVPPEWEAKVFAGYAPDDLLEDPRQESAQALLDRLMAHAPESPIEHRVGVLDESQPNALAFPGGLIVLTTGLLEGLESENELAMVLGHELGHYAGRDHLEGIGRALTFALVLGMLGVGDGLTSLVTDVAMRGYGREQEREADAFGLELVQAEYGHVGGATAFFERLPESGPGFGDRLAEYMSTHPMGDERVQDLTAMAIDRGWPLGGELSSFDGSAPVEQAEVEVEVDVEPPTPSRKRGVRVERTPSTDTGDPLPEVVFEDRSNREPLPEVVYEDR